MSFTYKYLDFANALRDALVGDPFYKTLEDTVSVCDKKEGMLKYMDYYMIEAEIFGKLYIPEDHKHGVSIWSKPIPDELEERRVMLKKSFIKDYLGEKSLDVYSDIVKFMSEKSDKLLIKDMWYLSIVGVLPQFQGQGYGVGLISSVLSETDKYNIPTFLETFTPRNMSFYKRLGYTAIDSYVEPTIGAEYWIMSRGPVKE
ncbi:MAG: hypothetical protein C0603_09180 [Denitrovibrio sp.]|nr:MAG: hypothetical protein C0603_09180 [Denitrovibrio sp.]